MMRDTPNTLNGFEALEALLHHKPIQRLRLGSHDLASHDSVLWLAPDLEWWVRRVSWRLNPRFMERIRDKLGGNTPEETFRLWWEYSGNYTYEWQAWEGDMPPGMESVSWRALVSLSEAASLRIAL
jgi:hypothetical protein